MNESNGNEMSLLEQLRQKPIESESDRLNPLTKEEEQSRMDLIIKHQSEFPLKLRQSIAAMPFDEVANPHEFLHQFHSDMFKLLEGRDKIDFECESSYWYGVNSDVDTEEEVELAIRVFVQVFRSDLWWRDEPEDEPEDSFCRQSPISLLSSSVKGLSFIPLVMRLMVEFGVFARENVRVDVGWDLSWLFCNCCVLNDGSLLLEPFLNRGDAPLTIITRLIEDGFVKDKHIVPFLFQLFRAAEGQDYTFIETRLRYLVDWNPKLLTRCKEYVNAYGHTHSSCLELYISSESGFRQHNDLQIFALLTELGMIHYPLALGFVFDERYPDESAFEFLCDVFGSKAVSQIVTEKLALAFGQYTSRTNGHKRKRDNNANGSNSDCKCTFKELLLYAVATNDKISRDGVYALLRFDPSLVSRR